MPPEGRRPEGGIMQPEGSIMWPVGGYSGTWVAYFPVPEGRGGILTILHGRADISQLPGKACLAVTSLKSILES